MNHTITSLLLLFAITVSAQTFPTIQGETLQDKQVSVPDYVKGKRAVIGIAFSLKADEALKKWSLPLYKQLMADGMGGMMSGNMYNANLCFVGMLRGIAKLGMGEMKSRSKKNVDAKLHHYFIVSDDDAEKVFSQLGIKEKSEPHFFVLDEAGNILFHTWGEYSDKKMDAITEALLK
jgi:hypothetical protein